MKRQELDSPGNPVEWSTQQRHYSGKCVYKKKTLIDVWYTYGMHSLTAGALSAPGLTSGTGDGVEALPDFVFQVGARGVTRVRD